MKMDINYYAKYTIEKYSTLKKYTSINNWHITYSNKTYRIKSITIIEDEDNIPVQGQNLL